MQHIVKLISIESSSPSIYRLLVEKPSGFKFVPGHSIMISINKPQLLSEKHPLTFTSTNDDPYLEFHVKTYPERRSFNNFLAALRPGDSLVLGEMFGSMRYVGPGLFLAGGIGVAPFLAIIRQLKKENALAENVLVYSAKYRADLVAERELRHMLGTRFHVTLTKEKREGYHHGRILRELLEEIVSNIPQNVYVIGSEAFTADMREFIAATKIA